MDRQRRGEYKTIWINELAAVLDWKPTVVKSDCRPERINIKGLRTALDLAQQQSALHPLTSSSTPEIWCLPPAGKPGSLKTRIEGEPGAVMHVPMYPERIL